MGVAEGVVHQWDGLHFPKRLVLWQRLDLSHALLEGEMFVKGGGGRGEGEGAICFLPVQVNLARSWLVILDTGERIDYGSSVGVSSPLSHALTIPISVPPSGEPVNHRHHHNPTGVAIQSPLKRSGKRSTRTVAKSTLAPALGIHQRQCPSGTVTVHAAFASQPMREPIVPTITIPLNYHETLTLRQRARQERLLSLRNSPSAPPPTFGIVERATYWEC